MDILGNTAQIPDLIGGTKMERTKGAGLMTYGIMHESTLAWLRAKAANQGWLNKVTFEPTAGHDPDCRQKDDDLDDCCSRPWSENTYEIGVIFGGALDETFYVEGDYEVNIADLIAEQCREEAAKQDGESWEIIVSEPNDTGVVRYRVSSWDQS